MLHKKSKDQEQEVIFANPATTNQTKPEWVEEQIVLLKESLETTYPRYIVDDRERSNYDRKKMQRDIKQHLVNIIPGAVSANADDVGKLLALASETEERIVLLQEKKAEKEALITKKLLELKTHNKSVSELTERIKNEEDNVKTRGGTCDEK